MEFSMVINLLLVHLFHCYNASEIISKRIDTELKNIVGNSRNIYVGGKNKIYKLDYDLNIVVENTTGPLYDGPTCIPSNDEIGVFCPNKNVPTLTDNYNMILIFMNSTILLVCGNVRQGTCKQLEVDTMKWIEDGSRDHVQSDLASTNGIFSTIASMVTRESNTYILVAKTINHKHPSFNTYPISLRSKRTLKLKDQNPIAISSSLLSSDQLYYNYFVDYKSLFYTSNYIYVSTVQQKALNGSYYLSKIARMSWEFKYYIEQPLGCTKNGIQYDLIVSTSVIKLTERNADIIDGGKLNESVLFVLFAQSDKNSKSYLDHYAVCTFLLSSLDKKLDVSIDKCKRGEKVPLALWTASKKTCSENAKDARLAPLDYINGLMIYTERTLKLGTIMVYGHNRGVTLYITSANQVQEFSVTKTGLYEYGKQVVPNADTSVFKKILMDWKKENLLLISNDMVAKVGILKCEMRKSCVDCLSGLYCGWCALENKCSLKSECGNSDKQFYFNNESVGKCPKFSSIQPTTMSTQKSVKISFTMVNIPQNTQYECSINGKILSTSLVGSNFICGLMDFKSSILKYKDDGSAEVKVSLVTQSDKKHIASSTITVYDCTKITICQTCIAGRFECGWCSKCAESNNKCDNQLSWVAYQGMNSTTFKSKCPVIDSADVSELPGGTIRSIRLSGSKLPQPTRTDTYKCVFKYKDVETTVNGKWQNESQILCDETKFQYSTREQSITASVHVLFGSNDIDTTAKFSIYKCDVDRSVCSVCLNAPSAWKCGWCESSKICTINSSCKPVSSWLEKFCPKPIIWNFEPESSTLGGGTKVSINGSDFGLVAKDVLSVTLAGQNCTVIPAEFEPQRLVCMANPVSSVIKGKIMISVNASGNRYLNGSSSYDFRYVLPTVTSISPNVGPCSGGTQVTLFGSDLDAGNEVEIYVDNNQCQLLQHVPRTPSNVTCSTKAVTCSRRKRRAQSVIRVSFHGFNVYATAVTFEYEVDPTVTDVFTNKLLIRIKTFASGGQIFRVEGQRLNIIQKPMMTFRVPSLDLLKKSLCKYSDKTLTCLAPNVSNAMNGRDQISVMLGFEMDSVANVREFKNITVLRDPVFSKFSGDNGVLELKTTDLILTGSGISVLSKDDVKVYVGDLQCDVTDVDERVVCTMPTESQLLQTTTNTLHPVKVTIGEGGVNYHLGFIQFYKSTNDEVSWVLYFAPPLVGVVILIIIIVVLCIIYRRKQRKDKESHELALIQIDRRECDVARECKEAFADYQTGMIDLTQDVDKAVSPYHTFRDFAMHVLCPGLKTHPIIEKNRDERDEWENAMVSLVKLMKNKDFLVTFIRTLESQSTFHMTDRCVVASLLMVVLQDDIRYVTDILKELLVDLIQKTGTGKRPKLLLRRTESVAEKLLTNWLAYTLHPFMESHVGEPLFKLFTAIDVFLDKEPVDAITFDARNSLSEDKLLRQKIDYKNLSINVEYINDDTSETFDGIPVLSSDTISQTRAKILCRIYKNKPFSTWPSPDNLLLGFVSANGAVLVLQDEDSTNAIEGEWKRVNTLDHYKVQDGSSLRLAGPGIMCPNASTGVLDSNPQLSSPPRMLKSSSWKRISSRSSKSLQELDKSDAAISPEPPVPNVAFQPDHASTPMLNNHANEPKLWHMVKVTDYPVEQKEDVRQSKMMAEVYLTRLLKTKETLQRFVDELFDSIFGLHQGGRVIPQCVKYLFDFLDKEAVELDILDWEVHHTWKNNSLPLRFWINMIKNPDFIFDIKKTNTVDSCLSVIAQLFMDSCSPDDHRLGKDSPSNKLLYAKEIPDYKKKVKRFYMDVKEAPFDEQAFEDSLDEMSEKYGKTFNSYNAACELMNYAVKYKVKVMESLEHHDLNEHAEKLQGIMENIPDD